MRAAITKHLRGKTVSLFHQLLASLPVDEALTTNYDTRFERAWRDAGRHPAVLPEQGTARTREWLLKLHGSVSAGPESRLVLSRGDYLRFEGEGTALAGLVQAMLLTRHLLFVGYSLRDDNFHRIVQQVRNTVSGARPGDHTALGTVITSDEQQLIHEVWKPDLKVIATGTAARTGPVRTTAMMLDMLGMAACGMGHFLNEAYADEFTPEEAELRDLLLRAAELVDEADGKGVDPSVAAGVRRALARFGAPSVPR